MNRFISISGRLNRIRFLAYTNIILITCFIVIFILSLLLTEKISYFGFLIVALSGIILATKFAAQRYHDVGASGWWALWCLTPGQPIIYLLLGTISGMATENKFGPPNHESTVALKFIAIVPIFAYLGFFVWWKFNHTTKSTMTTIGRHDQHKYEIHDSMETQGYNSHFRGYC